MGCNAGVKEKGRNFPGGSELYVTAIIWVGVERKTGLKATRDVITWSIDSMYKALNNKCKILLLSVHVIQ